MQQPNKKQAIFNNPSYAHLSVGVLALQGDFQEHLSHLHRLSVKAIAIRTPQALEHIQGLIIPGGESTAIQRLLLTDNTWYQVIQTKVKAKQLAIWGTCAGAILLAKTVDCLPKTLSLMDISIKRNAFGRQVNSFAAQLRATAISSPHTPFPAIFIRSPIITRAEKLVQTLASFQGKPVAVQQDRLLATSFHPELTPDTRWHEYFITLVNSINN